MNKKVRPQNLEEFATLISCYDFRIGKEFDLDVSTRHIYAAKLRKLYEKGEIFVMHLTHPAPLGVRSIAAEVQNVELANKIYNSNKIKNEILDLWKVPHAFLLDTIFVLVGGTVVFWWYMPPGIDVKPISEWVSLQGGKLYYGVRLPIHTCLPNPSLEDVPILARRMEELLKKSEKNDLLRRLKTPALAYVIMAVLDAKRLEPLKKLIGAKEVAEARQLEKQLGRELVDARLRWRYFHKYYRELSEHFVIGRYRVLYPGLLKLQSFFISAEKRYAAEIYGYMALKGSAAHMFYSDKVVMVGAKLTSEDLHNLVKLTNSAINIRVVLKIFKFRFPYELYDPLENRWYTRPVGKFFDLLRKLRLIE